MIHGLTGNHLNMRYYAEFLSGEYKVVSVDLRGRGDSGKGYENSSIFSHAKDIIKLIELKNYKDVILIGHSMGAYIASIVASKSSLVNKIILLDGTAKVSKRHDDIVKPSLSRLSKKYISRKDYVDEVKSIYEKLGVKWSDELKEIVEYEIEKKEKYWENKSDEKVILSDWNSFKRFNQQEIMSKIECPVFLVYAHGRIGPKKPLFLVEEYEETLKNTKNIETLDTVCNHYTMIFESQKIINDSINKFLKK